MIAVYFCADHISLPLAKTRGSVSFSDKYLTFEDIVVHCGH